MIPAWFNNAIVTGFQALYVLNLQDRPPANTSALTCEVWVNTLWKDNYWVADDTLRIESAFIELARRCVRWPTPKDLMGCLPARPAQKTLEDETYTAEQRHQNIKRLKRLLKKNKVPKKT